MKIKIGKLEEEEGTIKYEEISPEEAEEIAQKCRVIIYDTTSKIETAYYTDSYTILNMGPVQFKPELVRITTEEKYFTKYHYYKLVGISRVTLSSYRIVE